MLTYGQVDNATGHDRHTALTLRPPEKKDPPPIWGRAGRISKHCIFTEFVI